MYKQIGAILLVAGTCIGSGMIALPLVLAKIGIIPSLLLMGLTWFIMYYTSLINLELNLQAGQGLPLGSLGKFFSGKKAELIGTISLKLLSYALIAVFIYGGSSIFQELLVSKFEVEYSFHSIATSYVFITILLLLLPIRFIDYFNRLLFVGLILVIAILLAGLALTVNWSELPLFSEQYKAPSVWIALVPVVFTSFGFQVIFHTLTNYCNQDVKMLKRAFLWGSLIPACVYIVWTCSLLSVIYQNNSQFYQQMVAEKVEVGELIQVLSRIAEWPSIKLLIWWISLLAIATSVLGVSVGLCDSFRSLLSKKVSNHGVRHVLASVITILPAYLIVIYVPNAFISVLGLAGMILAVIAILLPVYLFCKIKAENFYYPELNSKFLIRLSIGVALSVIISELFNML